jgi:hypothetical protein
MTRGLHADTITELGQSGYQPHTFVEIELDDVPLYMWTGAYDITIDTKTYQGAGTLLQITYPKETVDVKADGFTISLSGIATEMIATALATPMRGRRCTIRNGVFKDGVPEGGLFIGAIGRCDAISMKEGANSATISVSVENHLIALNRPRIWRFTAAHQRKVSANDKACDYVEALADKVIVWGV